MYEPLKEAKKTLQHCMDYTSTHDLDIKYQEVFEYFEYKCVFSWIN